MKEITLTNEILENKKSSLCFLLLLFGCVLGAYNQSETYNNFFINIYNIFTSEYFLFSVIFSLVINNYNVYDELIDKYEIFIRVSNFRKKAFLKKETIFSTLYLFFISIILITSFSIFFSGGDLKISNNLNVAIVDGIMFISYLLLYLLSGPGLLLLNNKYNRGVSISLYFITYVPIFYILFFSEFKLNKYVIIDLIAFIALILSFRRGQNEISN